MRTERRSPIRLLFVVAIAMPLALLATVARGQQAYEDFLAAVANDRADEVKKLLARGIDPNTVDKNGDPALVIASRLGYVATVDPRITEEFAGAAFRFDPRPGRNDPHAGTGQRTLPP